MLLQNLQTAALLIIVCECGWHKIALCQNALPLQIKAFCCSCWIFGPVTYGPVKKKLCFCGQCCFRSIMLIGAVRETLHFLAIKRLPTVRTQVRSCFFGEMVSCSFDLYILQTHYQLEQCFLFKDLL